ncbi:MAG: aminotransferase class I/II-fold pyridoxal phosphate-dependent enzyme [Clostridia bacterium]|nr:aminotransferase class I/II-fold pyridoxal phosphate-dependent enzyme [Clostridia bacterium]
MKIPGMTDKISHVRSDIRGPIYLEALRMESAGEKILKLNTGNPGSFGFLMPDSVKRALTEGMDRAVPYCDLKGMPAAREAIAAYHRKKGLSAFDEDDIFLGNGVSEIVQMVTTSFLNAGDELLLPMPGYSLWDNCTYIAGAKPVFYLCDEKNGWNPDPEDIRRKIGPKTRGIVIINPNNPTGAIYSREILNEILSIARENDLAVFSDEIYDRLCLDGAETTSIASLAPDLFCVTFNGLSKSHVLCGFRCGWAVLTGPAEMKKAVKDGLTKLCAMRLCANALMQLVIPAAMNDPGYTEAMLVPGGRLYDQREATCSVLETIEGVSFVKNRAAFYLFPKIDKSVYPITDDTDFAMDLLHAKKLLVIPGSGFGWPGNDHLRLVMLPQKEILKKAMEDLGDFLADYRAKKR